MKTNTREAGFEEFIDIHLAFNNGYRTRSAKRDYDKALAMDPELVLEFVQKTQPNTWKKLTDRHGEATRDRFLQRLDEEITTRGALDIFRKGVDDHGVHVDMAYFQPTTGLNKETQALYEGNILSAIRQVKYSDKNENSIDMVLFLNGLPIFTVELKNQLTGQTVQNGMRQYKTDRDPKEKLLSFKRCLAHFAVDTEVAFMTTRLNGLRTRFLPFNRGNGNSAGNPAVPEKYKTYYMWEDLWTRESVLELVGRFLCIQIEEKEDAKGKKTKVENLVFPRYHQRDTVHRLENDAREHGGGRNYLIQHSAGSGKSNTIAWTAHRMSDLHDAENAKVFDSVIIVTDRRVLDRQLRDTVTQFEQTAGVVKAITGTSDELKEALESGEKIIVTTLQKFPVIVESVGKLSGKNFAVIIDEAHSSQTGESSKSLKQVLEATSLDEAEKEDDDSKEESLEDMVLKEMRSRRSKTTNISFFAFTATPKQKTLEIFGMQNPVDGKFYPFSLYSMKQAIEEGFILDVLKNYTTYQTYFELRKKIQDDPEYTKKKAQRVILSYVERHEHAIDKKIEIMVEHFSNQIAKEIDGRAKSMIVTKSRLHAVRYKLAMDKYLREHNYPFKALVAFSGTVKDGTIEYTEAQMNGIPEKNTAEEFKKDEFKFLIVAEKFQTGFDQPLLAVMYVDKKLGGVNAVQTLSRLNRIHSDKAEVFVLDFVNDTETIKDSFQPYYTTTVLSEATDPNVLHNLQRDILNFSLFNEHEVNDFAEAYFAAVDPGKLSSLLDKYVVRFSEHLKDEQEDFRTKAKDYIHKYAFISQILTFDDTRLEKLYVFLRFLVKKLPFTPERLPLEVLESVDMESYKIVKTKEMKIALEDTEGSLEPMGGGQRGLVEEEKDFLSKIIKDVNDKFGTEFSDDDRVVMGDMAWRLADNLTLQATLKNNTRDAAKIKYDQMFQEELISMLNRHFGFYKKLDESDELKAFVNQKIFDFVNKKVKEKNGA
jgi:type I restriction enzyme R subunit